MSKRDFGLGILKDQMENTIALPVLHPEDIHRTYGVQISFEDEDKKQLLLHYEIDVMCLETEDEHTFVFELHKKQLFIDNKKPDMVMDQFAEQCGNVLYPLQVYVNTNGTILDLANYDMILQRWQVKKEILKREFSGKQVDTLLDAMDTKVADPSTIITELKEQDWFVNLFFTPPPSIITRNKSREIKVPLVPYALPVAFTIKDTLTTHTNRKKDIIVSRKGIYSDSRTELDFLKGNTIVMDNSEKLPTGNVSLKYHMYDGSPIWDAIIGSCSLTFPSGKSNRVSIEIYHLKRKTPITEVEREAISKEKEENTPKPKQQKKRYFFFGKEIKLNGFKKNEGI